MIRCNNFSNCDNATSPLNQHDTIFGIVTQYVLDRRAVCFDFTVDKSRLESVAGKITDPTKKAAIIAALKIQLGLCNAPS